MKIAVVGAGAIGGYLGARLSAAGEEVTFIARGANLAAIKAELGDEKGALALEEEVFAGRARSLPDDHPDLQAARLNLAAARKDLGDFAGGLALLWVSWRLFGDL